MYERRGGAVEPSHIGGTDGAARAERCLNQLCRVATDVDEVKLVGVDVSFASFLCAREKEGKKFLEEKEEKSLFLCIKEKEGNVCLQ